MRIHEYLDLDVAREVIQCRKCETDLCAGDENYKDHVALDRADVSDLGPAFTPAEEILGTDPGLELRRYYCPSCGILLDHQVAMADDDRLHDVQIDLESL